MEYDSDKDDVEKSVSDKMSQHMIINGEFESDVEIISNEIVDTGVNTPSYGNWNTNTNNKVNAKKTIPVKNKAQQSNARSFVPRKKTVDKSDKSKNANAKSIRKGTKPKIADLKTAETAKPFSQNAVKDTRKSIGKSTNNNQANQTKPSASTNTKRKNTTKIDKKLVKKVAEKNKLKADAIAAIVASAEVIGGEEEEERVEIDELTHGTRRQTLVEKRATAVVSGRGIYNKHMHADEAFIRIEPRDIKSIIDSGCQDTTTEKTGITTDISCQIEDKKRIFYVDRRASTAYKSPEPSIDHKRPSYSNKEYLTPDEVNFSGTSIEPPPIINNNVLLEKKIIVTDEMIEIQMQKDHEKFLKKVREKLATEIPIPIQLNMCEEMLPIVNKIVTSYTKILGRDNEKTKTALQRQITLNERLSSLKEMSTTSWISTSGNN